MTGVGSHVGFVGLFGAHVEEVVLLDEFLQLRLDVSYFGPGELELVQIDFGLFEVAQEAELFGSQYQQSVTTATGSGRSADTMNVFLFKLIRVYIY